MQLMAAAAQRQPWRGLNRWRYVGDPARPVGLRDRTSERFNCDDRAYLASWENDCTIQTLHFLPPYYRGMQTGEVEREREREERRGPRKVQVEERRDPLSASRPLRALRYVAWLHPHVAHECGDTECGNRGLLGRLEHYFTYSAC